MHQRDSALKSAWFNTWLAGGPGDGALGEGQEEVVAPARSGMSRGLMRVWLVGGRVRAGWLCMELCAGRLAEGEDE